MTIWPYHYFLWIDSIRALLFWLMVIINKSSQLQSYFIIRQ